MSHKYDFTRDYYLTLTRQYGPTVTQRDGATQRRWSMWCRHQLVCDRPGAPYRPEHEGPLCAIGQAFYDCYWRSFTGEVREAVARMAS